ncbi:MAG: hypothetical protein QXT46_05760 [Pyrobaculum sp.]|jgi:hypothetical protein
MKIYIILVAIAVAAAFLPVELFISEAPRPPPDKIVTPGGILAVSTTPLWLYTWRATVATVALLFAAIVATFFIKPNQKARKTLIALSTLAALFHYLTLLFTSQPPGYGISIYPLFFTITINGTTQYYLDIGQIFLIYAFYNFYKIRKKLL